MRNARARRVGMVTLFGVLVLSIGLVRLVFMTGSAGAVPSVKENALAGFTQSWAKVLPAAERFVILTAFTSDAVLDKNTDGGCQVERCPLHLHQQDHRRPERLAPAVHPRIDQFDRSLRGPAGSDAPARASVRECPVCQLLVGDDHC